MSAYRVDAAIVRRVVVPPAVEQPLGVVVVKHLGHLLDVASHQRPDDPVGGKVDDHVHVLELLCYEPHRREVQVDLSRVEVDDDQRPARYLASDASVELRRVCVALQGDRVRVRLDAAPQRRHAVLVEIAEDVARERAPDPQRLKR
jgi:hypothetical protein